jgi:choline transporter-like protein 2/4/5
MIWENAGRFTAQGGVGYVFNFLGKLLITCLSAYLGYFIITHEESFTNEISSPVAPTVVFAIVSYLVAALFMGVYEISADTIIQAYILDEKIHGENCTVYAPEPIKEFMDDYAKEN